MSRRLIALMLALIFGCGEVRAAPLIVPFDFSRSAIGLEVTVKGTPLYMILDTGVDPSVIDLERAGTLQLKVDRNAGGEASGEGDAKHAVVFPAVIDQLAVGGREFAPVQALATDTSTLSSSYGRRLDGVLGYSFLTDKVVLIDYSSRTVGILDGATDAIALLKGCARPWHTELRSFADDSIPIIAGFHFGAATGPVSLDTGSNGAISLYQAALDLPGLRAALVEKGEESFTGARGSGKAKSYVLNAAVGFGPFSLPAGEAVTLRSERGSADTRVANIGNKLFADMKLKILLDYRARRMSFYGGCPQSSPGGRHHS